VGTINQKAMAAITSTYLAVALRERPMELEQQL
jgi:hypothetical protein